MGFEQSGIKVRQQREFQELKDALVRVLAPGAVDEFLKRIERKGIRVRDVELVLASGALDEMDETLGRDGARKLYDALSLSDQALLREFYLSKVEEVASALRMKYQKLYRYY